MAAVHAPAQTPALQTGVPDPQTVPHAPQLVGSLPRSAHFVEQDVVPVGHAQAPAVQV